MEADTGLEVQTKMSPHAINVGLHSTGNWKPLWDAEHEIAYTVSSTILIGPSGSSMGDRFGKKKRFWVRETMKRQNLKTLNKYQNNEEMNISNTFSLC